MVEHLPSKEKVAGSRPVSRSLVAVAQRLDPPAGGLWSKFKFMLFFLNFGGCSSTVRALACGARC